MSDVGKWLEKTNITPRELSEELGLSRQKVSRLLVGKDTPDRLLRWALLGLKAEYSRNDAEEFRGTRPTDALPEMLADDRWAGQTARLALPVLVELAKSRSRKTVTYGALHEMVVQRGGQADIGTLAKMSFPCGKIAYAMEEASERLNDNVPPLSALVVNGVTGLPSYGIDPLIKSYLKQRAPVGWTKSSIQRRRTIEQVWNDIFEYSRWDEVQLVLGLSGDPVYDR